MTNQEVDTIIKALANPVRRDILSWLKNQQQEFPEQQSGYQDGVCVGQIYERAGLSQSTISSHLATLQRAGLLISTRAGQWVYYQRNETVIDAFTAHMKQAL
jgi:DNA-binding transcriptional ArsR family regulator